MVEAHSRHADAGAVVGGLVNATDATLAGRANFLSFTSPWQAPLQELPSRRPPPVSTLSFKREAVAGLERPGQLETEVMPRLFNEGRMVAASDVRVLHYQDHGLVWSVRNAFWNCRTAYGYAPLAHGLPPPPRRDRAGRSPAARASTSPRRWRARAGCRAAAAS